MSIAISVSWYNQFDAFCGTSIFNIDGDIDAAMSDPEWGAAALTAALLDEADMRLEHEEDWGRLNLADNSTIAELFEAAGMDAPIIAPVRMATPIDEYDYEYLYALEAA